MSAFVCLVLVGLIVHDFYVLLGGRRSSKRGPRSLDSDES